MRPETQPNPIKLIWLLVATIVTVVVGFIAWFIIFVWHPFLPEKKLSFIETATGPGGMRYVAAQLYNGNFGEPYSVVFLVKSPGQAWVSNYVDHQDNWWRTGRIEIDSRAGKVKLFDASKLRGELDSKTMIWSADGSVRGPWTMPVKWEPAEGGDFWDVR